MCKYSAKTKQVKGVANHRGGKKKKREEMVQNWNTGMMMFKNPFHSVQIIR